MQFCINIHHLQVKLASPHKRQDQKQSKPASKFLWTSSGVGSRLRSYPDLYVLAASHRIHCARRIVFYTYSRSNVFNRIICFYYILYRKTQLTYGQSAPFAIFIDVVYCVGCVNLFKFFFRFCGSHFFISHTRCWLSAR